MSASAEAATYVFCVVQSGRPPSLRGVPGSIPGAGALRLIPIDRNLWAVVADVPLEQFTSERLQEEFQDVEAISRHALAHAAVVEFFFRRATVVPLRLFTLFSADDKVQAHLRGRRTRLRKLFDELRGLEEWGVRVIAGAVEAKPARSPRSGRDYLVVKKRLNDRGAVPPRATVKETTRALRSLTRLASKVRKETFPPPGRDLPFMTGASMLVPTTRRSRWKKEVAKLGAALAKRGHRLEVTGPWPPYHFVAR
ncbi:MAG TPA: GvpL/GvpF family gas vesicle protein [Vicinamibacterales bacterium]|nr:GvpL/GvpF family gas vesicle protein [Vicinamibacterales bacterium]